MNPAGDYDYMIDEMGRRYDRKIPSTVGILFANPSKQFVRDEILGNIEYANVRSGLYIDFFLAGYSKDTTYDEQEKIIQATKRRNWYFSNKMFSNFIEQLERISNWKYKGETELLLLEYKQGRLCFDKVISIWLDKAVRDGFIYSTSTLFEEIFRVARAKTETAEFRNALVMKNIKDSVFGVICSLIPNENISGVIKSTSVFLVNDFSKL